MANQWEYRMVTIEAVSQGFLNAQGADGFELIEMIGGQPVGNAPNQKRGWLLIFKKPK